MDECALYTDTELYDRLFPSSRDIACVSDEGRRQRILMSERFYVEEAKRSGGPLLELACGTGRLTIPLAQQGVEVTGTDLSLSMLEAARAKAKAAGVAVEFRQEDMRNFEMGRTFAAVLIAGNSLLHLVSTDDLKSCLRCVHRHLTVGGRLVFDIAHWDIGLLARDPAQRYPGLGWRDAVRGEIISEETASYDPVEQVRYVKWFCSAAGAPDFRVIEYSLRAIFPQELLLLLDATGFRLDARYGEFTREPFGPASPRQVCVCTAV